MPYAMVPPGYRAALLGSAARIEDLGTFTPLEEGTAEGALILMRLDFTEPPSNEALAQLNQACLDAGIPTWPGYDYIVYADTTQPSVYLAWQKGFAWMPIIIGVIAILPIIGLVLLFTSETFRTIMQLIVMMLFMWVMMKMMSGMMPALKPAEAKRELPPKKPLSERIANRIDGLAEGVGRIIAAAERGETTAAGRVSGVLSGISSVVRAVKGAPEKVMSSSEKARAAEDIARLTAKLEEYEGLLTPEQKAKLAREREIMEELKYGYV